MFELPVVKDDPAFKSLVTPGHPNIIGYGQLNRLDKLVVGRFVFVKHYPILIHFLFHPVFIGNSVFNYFQGVSASNPFSPLPERTKISYFRLSFTKDQKAVPDCLLTVPVGMITWFGAIFPTHGNTVL